jgi:hypothetical protein
VTEEMRKEVRAALKRPDEFVDNGIAVSSLDVKSVTAASERGASARAVDYYLGMIAARSRNSSDIGGGGGGGMPSVCAVPTDFTRCLMNSADAEASRVVFPYFPV